MDKILKLTRRKSPIQPSPHRKSRSQALRRFLAAGLFILSLNGVGSFLSIPFRLVTPAWAESNDEELFLVAQKAFEDGFYDVAIRYLEQYLEKYPQTNKRVQALLLLGQCRFFQNQYLKAFEIFQKLLDQSEFRDATLFWLGETYFKGSDFRQAEKYYRELIDVYPNSIYVPQGYFSLGWTYFNQGEFEKAKDMFLKMIKKFPADRLAEDAIFKIGECEYEQNNDESAIQFFTNYLSRFPQSTRQAEAYFYIAESYYRRGDFLTAVTFYAKAADMAYDPKIILMSKVSMGWCYLKLEKFDLARQFFSESQTLAEDKNLDSDDILLGQANLAMAQADYETAQKAYLDLLQQYPQSPRAAEARLGKANIDYTLKKYALAIEEYQGIIDASPQSLPSEILEKAYYGLAWTYLKSGNIDASIKYFEDVMAKTESKIVKVSALTQIGDAYHDANQWDKAIEIYDRILKDYPDSMYADYVQFRQGIALLRQDKIEAATMSFQSLQSNFPHSKYLNDVQYYLGLAYFKKEDWRRAIEDMEEYLKQESKDLVFLAEANYVKALSQFNLKNYQDALATFEYIAKNDPSQTVMRRVAEFNIAKCLHYLGNSQEAVKRLENIIKTHPQTETAQEAVLWLGDHFLETGLWDNAINYYQKFIKDFPGSDKVSYAQYECGQAYHAQGNLDKAMQCYKLISDAGDKDVVAKAKLAIADIFSKEANPKTAIDTYLAIAKSVPEYKRDAYAKIAAIQIDNKQFSDAVLTYQQALSSEKMSSGLSDAELQFSIGDAHELLNQKKQAIDVYLKIPYLYPNQTPWVVKAYLRVGRIFEESERWLDAQSVYQKIAAMPVPEAKYASERIDWIKANTSGTQGVPAPSAH